MAAKTRNLEFAEFKTLQKREIVGTYTWFMYIS